MPNYAAQWQAVWDDYVEYANRQPAQHLCHQLVEQVESERMLPTLRLLNTYLGEVDTFKAACRDLHKQPTNNAYVARELTLRNSLTRDSAIFVGQAARALETVAETAQHVKTSALVMKPDAPHRAVLMPLLQQLTAISNGLTQDRDLYGPRLQVTLETIRRNPG